MRIASLTIIAILVAAMPAVAEEATLIKKPKALGTKKSTLTSYESRQGGPHINCQGICFGDGRTLHWQCKGTHADVACSLKCFPPPPVPECLPF